MNKAENRSLTGLRGVAAVLVTIYHFCPGSVLHSPTLAPTLGRAYLSVDLFFILSGYVMALTYARGFADGVTLFGAWAFLSRRVARIFPLYLALLAFRIAYSWIAYGSLHVHGHSWALNERAPAGTIAANLLLVQSWGIAHSISGQAWSVSTEWAAYFVLPFLAAFALFHRERAVWLGVAAIALVGLAAAADAHDGAFHGGSLDAYDGRRIAPLLRCFGGFWLGLLVYRASETPRLRGLASGQTLGIVLVALLLAGLAAGLPDLLLYPLLPVLMLHLVAERGVLARALAWGPIWRLGILSYAIYLLHPLLMAPFDRLDADLRDLLPAIAADAGVTVVIGVALLGICWAAFRFIEEPGRNWVRAVLTDQLAERIGRIARSALGIAGGADPATS